MLDFAKWFSLILCWIGVGMNFWMIARNCKEHKRLVRALEGCRKMQEYYEQKVKEISNDA